MKWMTALLLAMSSAMLGASDLRAQVARNLTGNWQLDAQTDPASVSGPSAGLVKTAYTGNLVLTHDGSYTFTGTWTMDGQTGTLSNGSISDIYVGFMVSGYKLGGTMPTTSFYFSGSLNAALDTITGTFNGFAQDGTRWGGLFNLNLLAAVVNLPPTVSAIPDPTSQSFVLGETVDITITAPDPNALDVVTLSASPLPPGLSFTSSAGNPAVGYLRGTLTQGGTFPVTFTATDNWGASALVGVRFGVATVNFIFPPPRCLCMTYRLQNTEVMDREFARVVGRVLGGDPNTPHRVTATISSPSKVSFFTSADDLANGRTSSRWDSPLGVFPDHPFYFEIYPVNASPGHAILSVFLDGFHQQSQEVFVGAYYPFVLFPPIVGGPPIAYPPDSSREWLSGPTEPVLDTVEGRGKRVYMHKEGVGVLPFAFFMPIFPWVLPQPFSDPQCLHTRFGFSIQFTEGYSLRVETGAANANLACGSRTLDTIPNSPLFTGLVYDLLHVYWFHPAHVAVARGPFIFTGGNGRLKFAKHETPVWFGDIDVTRLPPPNLTIAWDGYLDVVHTLRPGAYADGHLRMGEPKVMFRITCTTNQ